MNLGFLSSSRRKDKAEEFNRNLLTVIKVEDKERDPELDYGYADISHLS